MRLTSTNTVSMRGLEPMKALIPIRLSRPWSDQDSVKRWNRTKYFVDKTLDFLQKNKDKPCFINVWTDDVHTPWIAGDDEKGRFDWKPQEERSFKFVLQE